ncbi:MAG: hypothetical protein Mars2KO_34950 [Maribacter sp.]|uniref:hypothetical protein n=1 Tax=Maribacter sp. 2307UL18-2 TaxID=3386274 RepID=UPI0039BCFF9D
MSISKQKTALFFRLSISVTVFSALFKFMPSALIVLGAFGMMVFLSLQLYQKDKREPLDYVRLLLIVVFSSNYAFILLGLPYVHVLTLMTKLALIAFLLLYIKQIITSFQDITQNTTMLLSSFSRDDLSYLLADLATVYIVIASLFKILHWEIGILNGNLLLAIGLFSALISLIATSRELGK